MTNRKNLILFLAILFILAPLDLIATEYYIKMSFGLNNGNSIQETVYTPEKYASYVSIGNMRKSGLGIEFRAEFIFKLSSNLSLSFGVGHIENSIKGMESNYWLSDIGEYFSVIPQVEIGTTPIFSSLIFSIPLNSRIQMNFQGGVDYHFGYVESKADWYYAGSIHRSAIFSGSKNGFGSHIGVGFDFTPGEILTFFIESFYQYYHLNGVENFEVDIRGEEKNPYIDEIEEYIFPEFDYDLLKLSASSLSILIGLKFKF